MNKKEAHIRIKKLRDLINYHRQLYHNFDRQEISDFALDSLKKELFDLEQQFPEFITSDSPTQRTGGKPLEKFEKIKHIEPMLSLNDAFSKEDIEDWLVRVSKLLNEKEKKEIDFYCEPKIDGLAVELVYENGIFKTGSTRGDGLVGEDITQNLKTIEDILLKIDTKEKIVVVRGEVFIKDEEFIKANTEREKNNLPLYASKRNLAAGSIRQLNSKITLERNLNFFAYDIILGCYKKTHEEKHKCLAEMGFKVNKYNKYCKDIKEIFILYEDILRKRKKLNYEIDGIVIIINNNNIFNNLGVVGKAYRGAIALKFPSIQITTIIEDIKIQVGRTGVLTPVAVLKPVKIGGVLVSRATLHNEDEIIRLGIKIGDTVIVERAGDVIPDIIKVFKEMRTGKEKRFQMPIKCPSCKGKIKKEKALYYCINKDCYSVFRKKFYHFVSKKAFDIEGLGPKIIDKLIEEKTILDPADLFSLKEGDLIVLERFAEKSAANIVASINLRKEITLDRFIYSLGIRGVGEETARDLAIFFQRLENLEKCSIEDLKEIENIGPKVSFFIYEWFSEEKNKEYLKKIKKYVKVDKSEKKTGKLEGKKFLFTGELELFSREKVKEKIREMGGKTLSSISENLDYLVVGKNPGSKLKKAKEKGVKIIEEKEFLKMIEG